MERKLEVIVFKEFRFFVGNVRLWLEQQVRICSGLNWFVYCYFRKVSQVMMSYGVDLKYVKFIEQCLVFKFYIYVCCGCCLYEEEGYNLGFIEDCVKVEIDVNIVKIQCEERIEQKMLIFKVRFDLKLLYV